MDQESKKHLIQDIKPRKKSHHVESFSIEDSLIVSVEVDSENEISKADRIKALLLMSISAFCFMLTISLCKYGYLINEKMNGMDYLLFRGTILMFFATLETLYRKVNVFRVPREIYVSVIFRYLTGLVGMALYFYAIKYLPMSQSNVILSISPLITAILAYFLLSEILVGRDILCLIGAFGGAVVVNVSRIGEKGVSESENNYLKGILLIMVSIIFRSTAPVAIRQMSKYVSSIYSPFYFALGLFSHSVFLLTFCRSYLNYEYYNLKTIMLFSGSAFSNYIAQSLMSIAYNYEKATVLAPFSYLVTCGLLLIDCLLFGYDFNIVYFLGFTMILVCVLSPLLFKISKK
ncbi:unnamed protein product [Moneuplotes crassus]|uniref:EamA domain-containing protein n=1 Tax=Euplotes crassus TaxID=5936 RepID=A0AAD1XIE2_EUPCR|nr:unnamed protein product [Moneuplotes crassus]